ncbi:hypothetical protein TNCV_2978571 [Trichonephila clavipes]|nr:hypothetical protein TNCV_2978571 [Trichonephila clavipes]
MHVKFVEVQSPPVGVAWKFGEGIPAQVSSSSLDRSSETGTFFTQSSATVQGRRHRYCQVSVPVHNHLTEETVRSNKRMARDCWYKKERKKFF